MSYDRRKEPVGDFYKRRFLSIAPGYWITIVLNIITVLLTIAVFGYSRRWQSFTFINVSENFLLLNGFSIGRANNYIVRGGWYVGTTVILYVLYPLLAQIYKRIRANIRVFFPFLLFAVVFLLLFLAGSYSKALYCSNYSFIYYSFFNQLPCYTLGIVLYDLYKRDEIKRIKCPLLWSVMLLLVSFFFFYVEIPYAFVVEPFVFGLSVSFAICWIMKKPFQYDSSVSKIIQSLGVASYSIYLIHTLVVYDLARLITKYVPDSFIIWLVWLPIALLIIYALSIPYDKLVGGFQKRIKKCIK